MISMICSIGCDSKFSATEQFYTMSAGLNVETSRVIDVPVLKELFTVL